ncbi:transposase, partial [Empedobacter sp.]
MMKGQKNHYEASFKLLAVELSYERSNISELAREIGIKASLLYKWRKDYQEYG